MLGAGVNKANVSGVKLDAEHVSIDGLGEGLGVVAAGNEEHKEPDYIEALQFTDTKPKKSKTKNTKPSDEEEST